jgi:hypothetical protein
MQQVSTTCAIGDTRVTVVGYVGPAEPDIGYPGDAEVEQVIIACQCGEQVDITELIHSIIIQGSEVWNNLAQKLLERD